MGRTVRLDKISGTDSGVLPDTGIVGVVDAGMLKED
jgi:hypothetical protein